MDAALKLFGAIMATTLTHLWAEPDHPAFLPSVGYLTMYGSPNPDTLYRNAAIDGGGEYRISGSRGTVPDVSIMPFGPPVAGGLQTFAPFQFDDLEIEPDGTFEVVLSASATGRREELVAARARDAHADVAERVRTSGASTPSRRVAIVRLDTDPRRAAHRSGTRCAGDSACSPWSSRG